MEATISGLLVQGWGHCGQPQLRGHNYQVVRVWFKGLGFRVKRHGESSCQGYGFLPGLSGFH